MLKWMSYENHKRRVANKAREQTTDARDIGKIPRPKNWQRRKACERDLRKYLLTYYAPSFPLPFSDDHERILKQIEARTLDGGLAAVQPAQLPTPTERRFRALASAPRTASARKCRRAPAAERCR